LQFSRSSAMSCKRRAHSTAQQLGGGPEVVRTPPRRHAQSAVTSLPRGKHCAIPPHHIIGLAQIGPKRKSFFPMVRLSRFRCSPR
jgi:hypothetical protein